MDVSRLFRATPIKEVSGLSPSLDSLLSPSQAARVLGVSSERVVQLANDGKLTAIRTALGRLFEPGDVEHLAREREAAARRRRDA